MMKKTSLITAVLFSVSCCLYAQPQQDKSLMEKERADLLKEIQDIEKDYKQVKGKAKSSLSELNVLKRKMELQERYINNISKEIRFIDDDIYRSNLEIYRLKNQLDTLKTQYAKSVVYAYKNRSNYDYLNFIFSSNSFNDAMKRISYLKQYRSYRERQVQTITETQQLIAQRQKQQIAKKEGKNVALTNQKSQVGELAKQKNEKATVVNQLKSQEKELSKQLTAKRKRSDDLKRAINAVIQREILAAKKEAQRLADLEKKRLEDLEKNKPASPVVTTNPTKPETGTTLPKTVVDKPAAKEKSYLIFNANEAALAANFEQNKGRLPWPVDNGLVCTHFGKYVVEGTKIYGDNPGVTICTPSVGQSVKAVFEGDVVAVHNLGDVQAVIVRHGKYFTSYSTLSSASVSKGQHITKGQVIGKTGAADDGSGGQVDFMLLIENREQNPELWLKRGG
jgi:septal ring factor EnvC (AmiA/AmiB activator)